MIQYLHYIASQAILISLGLMLMLLGFMLLNAAFYGKKDK